MELLDKLDEARQLSQSSKCLLSDMKTENCGDLPETGKISTKVSRYKHHMRSAKN